MAYEKLYCMVYTGDSVRSNLGSKFCIGTSARGVINSLFNWDLVYIKEHNLYKMYIQGPGDTKLEAMPMQLSGEYTNNEAIKELYSYIWNYAHNWECETFSKPI